MDIVFARGRATAADVQDGMSDPPSYSAVRALLRVLTEKGHLKIERNGSLEDAVATLLTLKQNKLTTEELDRLTELVDDARKKGR